MKSILDPSFRYTTSFNTDLSKTFARIRRDYRTETVPALQPSEKALKALRIEVRGKQGSGRVQEPRQGDPGNAKDEGEQQGGKRNQ
jgi:hypothetical protein